MDSLRLEMDRPSAADLLHQFALASLPGVIALAESRFPNQPIDHDWIAMHAYEMARAMIEQGTRAEKEFGQ